MLGSAARKFGETAARKASGAAVRVARRPVAGVDRVAPRAISGTAVMSKSGGYNFATEGYASSFRNLPKPNAEALRRGALEYLDGFDERKWYDEPVTTILKGEKLFSPNTHLWITKDALGRPNGHQYLATPDQISQIQEHIRTYSSPRADLRDEMRRIEHALLTEHSGFLIGNQCLDFQKQDGVTEMEESIMANAVERRLNDALLADEAGGVLSVCRKPVYVSCVSNFTNFLDLFRKTVRNLELGVPCVVLGRSNTSQHSYRWTELLCRLMQDEGVDPGMLTYASCSLDGIKDITRGCRDATGNLYATCSRSLAEDIKGGYPHTVSSTGGPNTLVSTAWTPGVMDAIRTSATIECAGQCTALRHAVVPGTVTAEDVEGMFDGAGGTPGATEALRDGRFDRIFENHGANPVPGGEEGYRKHGTNDVRYRVSADSLPPDDLNEYWRKAVVDVTARAPASLSEEGAEDAIDDLSRWLVRNQPISLAVNAPRSDSLELGRALFERTALVVYTVGSTDDPNAPPAMTCQARPQEAEVFGEFPPRGDMGRYTKFPVVVPSSTPAYGASYERTYLEGLSSGDVGGERGDVDYVRRAIDAVRDGAVRGYCVEIVNYLLDATSANPKRGYGTSRTALWGLERPPLLDGTRTVLRAGEGTSMDDLLPPLIPFYVTNAASQAEVSVDPRCKDLLEALKEVGISGSEVAVTEEDEATYRARMEGGSLKYYNAVEVRGAAEGFPTAGQFVSLYLPLGHVKSTMPDDEEFVEYFSKSKKWLSVRKQG